MFWVVKNDKNIEQYYCLPANILQYFAIGRMFTITVCGILRTYHPISRIFSILGDIPSQQHTEYFSVLWNTTRNFILYSEFYNNINRFPTSVDIKRLKPTAIVDISVQLIIERLLLHYLFIPLGQRIYNSKHIKNVCLDI